jgi:hypothetical protein
MSTQGEAKVKSQEELIKLGIWSTCLNCEHKRRPKGPPLHCARFKADPPPEVIAVGCFEWTEEIPF